MTPKQKKFIAEYLVDQNGTAALRRAGHKGSDGVLASTASRLLKNVKIKAAIDAGLAKQQARIAKHVETKLMSKEQWLERISAIATANLMDAFQADPKTGKLTMTIEEMKRSGFGKLIRKLKLLPGGKVEFDLHPVLPALELLGKASGWVKDIHEHSGSISIPQSAPLSQDDFKTIFSDPETAALALQLATKLSQPPAGASDPAEGDSK